MTFNGNRLSSPYPTDCDGIESLYGVAAAIRKNLSLEATGLVGAVAEWLGLRLATAAERERAFFDHD